MNAALDDGFIFSAAIAIRFARPLPGRRRMRRGRCSEGTRLDVQPARDQQEASREDHGARAQHGLVGVRAEGGRHKAETDECDEGADRD